MHAFLSSTAGSALAASLLALSAPAIAQTVPGTSTPDAVATRDSGQLTQPGQGSPGGPTSDVGSATTQGDIIVTANKRAENVQRVPLAVSVVAPAQLAAAGVRNFTDIGKVAPSLVVRPAEQPQNSNITLRGVGTLAFGIGVESSVAVLVDDVPVALTARAFTDLPDVERIEVLRGPQSTLYGKSASAGLINIITRAPTDELRVRANALVTSDKEHGGNVSISGPISPTLGFVVSAAYNSWDGNVRNVALNKEVNGRESVNVRGKLRWEPTDDSSVTLSANYINGNTSVGRPFVAISPAALLRGQAGLTPAVVFPGVTVGPDNQRISNNFDARTKYEGGGGYLRTELGVFGDTNLITVTSYDRFHLDDYLDQDDSSAPNAYGNNNQVGAFNSEQITNEVRLQSSSAKPFRYTVGTYFANVTFDRPFTSRAALLGRQLVRKGEAASGRGLRADRLGDRAQADADRRRPRPERGGELHLSRSRREQRLLPRERAGYGGHLQGERPLRVHSRPVDLRHSRDRLQGSDIRPHHRLQRQPRRRRSDPTGALT